MATPLSLLLRLLFMMPPVASIEITRVRPARGGPAQKADIGILEVSFHQVHYGSRRLRGWRGRRARGPLYCVVQYDLKSRRPNGIIRILHVHGCRDVPLAIQNGVGRRSERAGAQSGVADVYPVDEYRQVLIGALA